VNLLFLNCIAFAVLATPILILGALRSRSDWINRNHGWLSLLTWVLALFGIYMFLLPMLGLRPNPAFFRNQ